MKNTTNQHQPTYDNRNYAYPFTKLRQKTNLHLMLQMQKTAIENGYGDFEKAFNSKDSIRLSNCYPSDAKFMPQSSKALKGRAAIQKELTQWFKGNTPHIYIKLVELLGNEKNLAFENE